MVTTSRMKVGQRKSGSGPVRYNRSAPTRSLPDTRVIDGQVRPVVTPSSRRATGRRARWSIRSSVSNVATRVVGEASISSATAAEAPMPASTQPSMETTSTGPDSRAPTGCPHSGSYR